jgi:hypothetical protein
MPLPSRKRQTKKPTSLPKEFLRNVSTLFDRQFKGKLDGATFLVYGDLYPGESVLCISLAHPKTLRAASLHLSVDPPAKAAEQPELVTDQLKSMVDIAASWFAQCFESGAGLDCVLEAMADMDPAWQELAWEGKAVFVKLDRTNYTLEKAADDFLRKAGFEPEEEEEEEDGDEDGGRGPLQ